MFSTLLEYYRRKEDEEGNITFQKVKEEDIKICGYKLVEVIDILNGLDFERKTDILVTMKSIEKITRSIQDDFQNKINQALKHI